METPGGPGRRKGVALIPPPDEHGRYSMGLVHEYLTAALDKAHAVIAEVNPAAPWTYGSVHLKASDFALLADAEHPPLEAGCADPGPVEQAIARHIAAHVQEGATRQVGIGKIPEAVLSALHGRSDLGLHSGAIGDGIAQLAEAGVLTNARKGIDVCMSVAGILVGGERLRRWAHRNPALALRGTEYTHHAEVLASLNQLVAIHSAVEVGLTGQVNAEVAGGVYVSAVGGAMDFLRGAARSRGGLPIIVLPATARGATRIVAQLSGPVSTPRCDAGRIVTEHGVADLRGQPLARRVRAEGRRAAGAGPPLTTGCRPKAWSAGPSERVIHAGKQRFELRRDILENRGDAPVLFLEVGLRFRPPAAQAHQDVLTPQAYRERHRIGTSLKAAQHGAGAHGFQLGEGCVDRAFQRVSLRPGSALVLGDQVGALRRRQPPQIGPADRGGAHGQHGADAQPQRGHLAADAVADVEHVDAVPDAERNGHVEPVRQFLHQRLRGLQHFVRGEVRMADAQCTRRQLEFALARHQAQKADLQQRGGQPGDGGLGQARAPDQLGVGQWRAVGAERAQYFEPTLYGQQRGAVMRGRLGCIHAHSRSCENWISWARLASFGPSSRTLRTRPKRVAGPMQLTARGAWPGN